MTTVFDTLSAYEDLLLPVFTLILSYFAAKIIIVTFERYASRIAKKTQSKLDDRIVELLKKPLYFSVLLFGIYAALMETQFFTPLKPQVTSLFRIIFIAIATYVIIKTIKLLEEVYLEKIVDKRLLPSVDKIISIFIYAVAFIIILDQLGIEVTPLVASLGVATLAVGLALQDTLSNFFAGLYIFTNKPIRIGDYIEIDTGDKGFVEEIGWRSTRIKTLPNTIVIVPNTKLAQSRIINYHLPDMEIAVLVECGVSYFSDLEKVEKVTIEVAREIQQTVQGAVKNFEPFIRYHTFADSNINFTVILRAEKFVDQYLLKHEFIKKLHKRYNEEGIEISFPVRISYQAEKKR